jgi:hypothetical protein
MAALTVRLTPDLASGEGDQNNRIDTIRVRSCADRFLRRRQQLERGGHQINTYRWRGNASATLSGGNVAVAYNASADMFGKTDGILGLAYAPLDDAFQNASALKPGQGPNSYKGIRNVLVFAVQGHILHLGNASFRSFISASATLGFSPTIR